MPLPISGATAPRTSTYPDVHGPQNATGPDGPRPPTPKATTAPPSNVLRTDAHPIERANDTAGAALARARQGHGALAPSGGTAGAGPTFTPWVKTAGLAPSATSSPLARKADDVLLARIPREQMKEEVEAAEAAVKNAKTPEEKAAAEPRLVATKARADAWARAVITRAAQKYAGAGFSKGKDAARYEEALAGPGDDEKARQAMRGQSTCALFARGVWRHAGVADSRLENNYVNQHAVSDVKGIALSRGAWVDVSRGAKGKLPQKGDVLLIDDSPHKISPKTGLPQGREHVIVVVGDPRPDPTNPNKRLVNTVEGGQGTGGIDSQAFGSPENGGTNNPKTIRIDRKDGTLWVGSRKVMGWADGAKVASPTAPRTEGPPPPPRKAAAKAS